MANDFSVETSKRKLLTRVESNETGENEIREQLADLHVRLYGEFVAADSTEVSESYEVFSETLSRTGDARHAWQTTLTAMLQDIRIVYY